MRPATILSVMLFLPPAAAAEPTEVKVRITGLFDAKREAELKAVLEEWPEVKLKALDLARAEAVLAFDAAALFPKAKPEAVVAKLDEKVRQLSRATFGVKPASTIPKEKLQRVEIAVAGLDCRACGYAAYEIVAKVEGVEQATVSFKDGKASVLLDPAKADKAKVEAALKARGVAVR